MTIVHGQIESLKRIKDKLRKQGITRFNSTGEIHDFIKDYEIEREEVLNQIILDINERFEAFKEDKNQLQSGLETLESKEKSQLKAKINKLNNNYESLKSRKTKSRMVKAFNTCILMILKFRVNYLKRNSVSIVRKRTRHLKTRVLEATKIFVSFAENKEKYISERSEIETKELERVKNAATDLNTLIAGAIGENLVVKELQRLSDEFVLFNDFSITFDSPIYNKAENDRIRSIQIDHLLASRAGLFILETKNWSKSSIDRLDLRSPVAQIKRTSYALWVVLNGDNNQHKVPLNRHHWGDKKLPIKNVIVMINEKPKEEFQYVTVKTLKQLNGYVTYFKPIFSNSEFNCICEYLMMIKN